MKRLLLIGLLFFGLVLLQQTFHTNKSTAVNTEQVTPPNDFDLAVFVENPTVYEVVFISDNYNFIPPPAIGVMHLDVPTQPPNNQNLNVANIKELVSLRLRQNSRKFDFSFNNYI